MNTPYGSAARQLGGTILVLEAFVVGFAALVAFGLREVPTSIVLVVGGGALALTVCAGLLRWRFGRVLGSVLQAGVLAIGFAVPMMFLVGGIFAALWAAALRLGGRIDRERAERGAGAPESQPGG
jgi:hypothetical protein